MNWRKSNRLGILASLIVTAFVCYEGVEWFRWREQPDHPTGVALELRPAHQLIKAGEIPEFSLTLVNHGDQEVMLIEPGDGSDCGWRTPLIEWSRRRWLRVRCGNINGLKLEEVFTLKPEESRQLNDWVGAPYLAWPGRYRVAVRYTNRPDQDWSGIPLSDHDDKAMQMVRRSTKLSTVSNTVEIVIEK